jgi:hypothetical protein
METTHELLHLAKLILCSKRLRHTSFIWATNLFHEDFKYGDASKFRAYFGTNAEPLRV